MAIAPMRCFRFLPGLLLFCGATIPLLCLPLHSAQGHTSSSAHHRVHMEERDVLRIGGEAVHVRGINDKVEIEQDNGYSLEATVGVCELLRRIQEQHSEDVDTCGFAGDDCVLGNEGGHEEEECNATAAPQGPGSDCSTLGDDASNVVVGASGYCRAQAMKDGIHSASLSKVPLLLHRTLLYDEEYPHEQRRWLRRFARINPNLERVLWRSEDVLGLLGALEWCAELRLNGAGEQEQPEEPRRANEVLSEASTSTGDEMPEAKWCDSWDWCCEELHNNVDTAALCGDGEALPSMEDGTSVLHAYTGYRVNIQRADLARYLIMYALGGIYADFDILALAPLERLLARYPSATFLAIEESTMTRQAAARVGASEPIRGGQAEDTLRVANYMLLATPHHAVLRHIIRACLERAHLPVLRRYDVLYTTGPDVVSSVVAHLLRTPARANHPAMSLFHAYGGVVVPRAEADEFFRHLVSWHWVKDATSSHANS